MEKARRYVATDPTYRRIGHGSGCGSRVDSQRGADGARVAWVGSDQDFHLAMGFNVLNRSRFLSRALE